MHVLNVILSKHTPFRNFFPIMPISSPPVTQPLTGLIHQISGFPGGAAIR